MFTWMTSDCGRLGLARGAGPGLVLLAALLHGLAGAGPAVAATTYDDLDSAVTHLARQLVSEAGLGGEHLLVTPHDFYEENTARRLPLSETLSSRFRSAFSGRPEVRVLLEAGNEDEMMVLQGQWNRCGDGMDLAVWVRRPLAGGGHESSATVGGRIMHVAQDRCTSDLAFQGRHLVRALERDARSRRTRAVHVGEFLFDGEGVADRERMQTYLVRRWLRPAFAQSRLFRLVAPSASDGELSVYAYVDSDAIQISMDVLDGDGRLVSAANVDLARRLLPSNMFPPPGPRVFIVARERVSSKAALRDWLATRIKLVIGPMGTDIRRSNVARYLSALGARRMFYWEQILGDPSDIVGAVEKGIFDGVVTVDDRLVEELRPLYIGPPIELRSRSDFNAIEDVVIVTNR